MTIKHPQGIYLDVPPGWPFVERSPFEKVAESVMQSLPMSCPPSLPEHLILMDPDQCRKWSELGKRMVENGDVEWKPLEKSEEAE